LLAQTPNHVHHRRSRYAGLKALLPLLGPQELLARCPNLIPSSLAAVTAGGNTAPPATRLLLLVLRSLMPAESPQKPKTKGKDNVVNGGEQEEAVAAVRALWLRPVAQALLHPHRAARTKVADHLLQVN
jgi:hypothetical protein